MTINYNEPKAPRSMSLLAFMASLGKTLRTPMPGYGHTSTTSRVRNPAGSKILRKFYRANHEERGAYETAREWYRNLRNGS